MRQAFLITGFSNWGKSSIISELFGGLVKFSYSRNYHMNGVTFNHSFTVQLQSNDDLTSAKYLNQINDRISRTPDRGQHLIAALCASMDAGNNFAQVLTQPPFTAYDQLHIFLIEYKWEHHAKLIIDNIQEAGRGIPNVNFVVINDDRQYTDDNLRRQAKMGQIRTELNNILAPR